MMTCLLFTVVLPSAAPRGGEGVGQLLILLLNALLLHLLLVTVRRHGADGRSTVHLPSRAAGKNGERSATLSDGVCLFALRILCTQWSEIFCR